MLQLDINLKVHYTLDCHNDHIPVVAQLTPRVIGPYPRCYQWLYSDSENNQYYQKGVTNTQRISLLSISFFPAVVCHQLH